MIVYYYPIFKANKPLKTGIFSRLNGDIYTLIVQVKEKQAQYPFMSMCLLFEHSVLTACYKSVTLLFYEGLSKNSLFCLQYINTACKELLCQLYFI